MVELCPACGRPVDEKTRCGCRESEAQRAGADVSLELDRPANHRSAAPPPLDGNPRVAIASGRPPPMNAPSPRSVAPPSDPSELPVRVIAMAGAALLVVAVAGFVGRKAMGAWWSTHLGDDATSTHHVMPNGMLEASIPEDFSVSSAAGQMMTLQHREHREQTVVLWAPAATSNMGAIVSGPDTTTLEAATTKVTAMVAKERDAAYGRREPIPDSCRSNVEESLATIGELGNNQLLWTCAFRTNGVVYVVGYTIGTEDGAHESPRLRRIAERVGVRKLTHCTHMDSGWLCPPR